METLRLSWEGQKLEIGWRGVQQMPHLDGLHQREKIKWETEVLKPLAGAGLDFHFLEHLEICMIASTDEVRMALPLFSADSSVEAALEERKVSGRLEAAEKMLVETFGDGVVSLLRFRLVLRQVREAQFGGRPVIRGQL